MSRTATVAVKCLINSGIIVLFLLNIVKLSFVHSNPRTKTLNANEESQSFTFSNIRFAYAPQVYQEKPFRWAI